MFAKLFTHCFVVILFIWTVNAAVARGRITTHPGLISSASSFMKWLLLNKYWKFNKYSRFSRQMLRNIFENCVCCRIYKYSRKLCQIWLQRRLFLSNCHVRLRLGFFVLNNFYQFLIFGSIFQMRPGWIWRGEIRIKIRCIETISRLLSISSTKKEILNSKFVNNLLKFLKIKLDKVKTW